ncbi:DUF4185 domain-containing protein [Nocardia sp. CDC186]|uniref:DUF4185 domain-containing protein n=1 Tax=Nocardia implantans TaxID=3108168 RepID=A0ABU6AN82_9NOCA|nr:MULTISPECIES: DUF4185 domain-containing protein [unclassified Nocardia]MBF6191999.1 DUF4185 domain-containing protein [Nocardia beijingensis]MEA3530129.1 DUF4185 domain-containing protein [Nocardia sp. CDC192]MEB3508837.1 DUF4185 domain-containing protein [Nocardia sp. CDC186]
MRASGSRSPYAPAFFGALLAGALAVPAPTAQAAPFPWAPPPVNSCGEVGFDPLNREPDPAQPPPPPLPPQIDIPVPIPELTPVPVPDPPQDNTRIVPEPLPENPCDNPCPDIRDYPEHPEPDPDPSPTPETGADEKTGSSGSAAGPDSGSGSGSASGSGSSDGSGSSSGSGSPVKLPRIEFKPETEPIPVPVPGGPGEEPQPAPPQVVHPAEPGPLAAAVAAPAVESVRLVGQVTGHGSDNRTDMRWQVDGTDLGLMWETRPGEVAVVFGDTFGKGWGVGGAGNDDQDWRSNVIGFSTDRDLDDGLTLDTFAQDSRCHAAEILGSRKVKNWETTTIPTSGFAVGDRQYLSYMSVNRWSRIPGLWWTNYGGLAYSDDRGRTWRKDQHAKWENLFGLGKFQVAAMVPQGDYVYMFGTPNGRIGTIALARVPKHQVLNKSAYQYWVGGTWAPAAENQATPLVLGIASELSVRYDRETEQWQMVYLDSARGAIVLRTAASPQGAWTDAIPLVSTADYPKSYGGFIHPWSTGEDLYFMLSAWDSYNVYLMHARLRPNPGQPARTNRTG